MKIKNHYTLIPLSKIAVLPQMRRHMKESVIDDLATSICRYGLIHPILVVKKNDEICGDMVRIKNVTMSFFKPFDYVLIAGHQRLEACKRIFQKEGGDYASIEARVLESLTVQDFLSLQMGENIHDQPPPEDFAGIVQDSWDIFKEIKKGSLAAFAKEIGRSDETVRNYLKFNLLPEKIQEYVSKGYIAYGVALTIAPLADESAETLDYFALMAAKNGWTVKEAEKAVKDHLIEKTQMSIFDKDTFWAIEKDGTRRAIDAQVTKAFYSALGILDRIVRLRKAGLICLEESPLSSQGPLKAFQAVVNKCEDLLPLLREQIEIGSFLKASRVVGEAGVLLKMLVKEEK